MLTKKQLKEYLYDNWDVTLDLIVAQLKVPEKDVQLLKKLIQELEDEGWILKSFCDEHSTYEYSPGYKQENYR